MSSPRGGEQSGSVGRAGEVVGGYELESKLSQDARCTEWLGRLTRARGKEDRAVLKILNADLAADAGVLARFDEQARLAQRLDHPNVAKLVACGRDGARCFFAREFIDGIDLHSARMEHAAPIPPSLAAALIADACKALAYAHGKKVVHGDISLEVIRVDVDGRVRLMDFGLARAVASDEREFNVKDDLNAMGLAFRRLLGTPISRALQHAIDKATGEDPEGFSSAQELEAALRAYLRQHPAPMPSQLKHQVAVWMSKHQKRMDKPTQRFTPVETELVTAPMPAMVARQLQKQSGLTGEQTVLDKAILKGRSVHTAKTVEMPAAMVETLPEGKRETVSAPKVKKESVTKPKPAKESAASLKAEVDARRGQLNVAHQPRPAHQPKAAGAAVEPRVPAGATVPIDPAWDGDTDPRKEPPPLPSVMLDPELEKLAVRHHGEPKKKKGKPGKK